MVGTEQVHAVSRLTYFENCSVYISTSIDTFFMLVCYLDCPSTLKMEVICFSEISVEFQRITLRHIPEDRIL
jgi:hypothetical protein